MAEYIDKSYIEKLVQARWSGNAIVTAIASGGISAVPAVPLDRIKEAREEMQSNIMGNHFLDEYNDGRDDAFKVCVAILDKLVAEAEG